MDDYSALPANLHTKDGQNETVNLLQDTQMLN